VAYLYWHFLVERGVRGVLSTKDANRRGQALTSIIQHLWWLLAGYIMAVSATRIDGGSCIYIYNFLGYSELKISFAVLSSFLLALGRRWTGRGAGEVQAPTGDPTIVKRLRDGYDMTV
jgi:hypothetical protein